MKFVFAHCPKTAGTSITRSLWRICDDFSIIHPNFFQIYEFPWGKFTDWMNIRFLGSTEDISSLPSISGHFLAWQLMEFLGLETSRRYHWFTVLRDPVDWAVSLFNFTHHLSRDPLAPHFGWRYEERFSDWIAGVEPNVQTAFAPDREAGPAIDFARAHGIDLVPLPSAESYMDVLYRRCGVPPLPTPNYMRTIPFLRREDLSGHDIGLIRSRMSQDVRLYDTACEQFVLERPVVPDNELTIHTPKAAAEFARLAHGGPVYIYGSGTIGRVLLRTLLDSPGVAFGGFLDSFQAGTVGQHPVHHVDAVPAEALRQATIIIGSKRYARIVKRLMAAGTAAVWDGYPYAYSELNQSAPHIAGRGGP